MDNLLSYYVIISLIPIVGSTLLYLDARDLYSRVMHPGSGVPVSACRMVGELKNHIKNVTQWLLLTYSLLGVIFFVILRRH